MLLLDIFSSPGPCYKKRYVIISLIFATEPNRPQAIDRRGSVKNRVTSLDRGEPLTTRVTYQNVYQQLIEQSEQISRLEYEQRTRQQQIKTMREQISIRNSEYNSEIQSRPTVSEDRMSNMSTRVEADIFPDSVFSKIVDQDSLHQASLRTNASQVELLIERNGQIIPRVDWETIQRTPPLSEYATQRVQAPRRNNTPYYDGEIRALTIIENWRSTGSVLPDDRIIIRGPTAPCADCLHNVRNYAVNHNVNIDLEYTGARAIFNARHAAPEKNLSNSYGGAIKVNTIRAPLDSGFFHRISCNDPTMRILRPDELSRQLRGRNVSEREGRVESGVIDLPSAVREEPMSEVTEQVTSEDVLRRSGINL